MLNQGDDVSIAELLPDWIKDLRTLTTGLGTAGGYAITESPQAFVEYLILDLIQQSALGLAGEVGSILAEAGTILGISIVEPLDAALGPAANLVGGAILGLIFSIVEIGESIAASAGPLAPIIVLATYAAVLLIIGGLAVALWRGYLLIRSSIV
jgi:hypothetical protein